MKTKKYFSLISLTLMLTGVGSTCYAQPIKFLGLEMGVDRPAFPRCTNADSDAQTRKRICWIDKPYVGSDGQKLGAAYIPNEAVPEWAVYAIFELQVTKKNGIRGIKVQRGKCVESDLDEIVKSISARFGKSKEPRTPLPLLMRWYTNEGYVQLFASDASCNVEYRSPELQAAEERAKLEREKEKQARPIAP